MLEHPFGATPLTVPVLGLGTGPLGSPSLEDSVAGRLLNHALDVGVRLLDAAPSYGLAEDRIARHVGHRRREFVLSTKCGYGVPGCPDWTYDCIVRGVDLALRRLGTDVIDVLHLHSCDSQTLARGEVVEGLLAARAAGKIRVAAYSGDAEALAVALELGVFGSVQLSVNVCDQRALSGALPTAARAGLGVMAKRALANSVYHAAVRPDGYAEGRYWDRLQRMRPDLAAEPALSALFQPGPGASSLALRFSAFSPAVHVALVGTSRKSHLDEAVEAVERGPLPDEARRALREAFARHEEADWGGLV